MNTFIGLMIPFLGTVLGASCVFFSEKWPEAMGTEGAARFCVRRYGSSLRLVAADPFHGYGVGHGKAGICACGRRTYAWSAVPAFYGSGDPPFAYGSIQG